MLEWMKDEEINQYFRFQSEIVTLDSIKKFIASSVLCEKNKHYAIVDDNDVYLGTISLKNIDMNNLTAEYAIALRKIAIGKEIARDATIDILNKAFQYFKLNKVYLNVIADNKRAIKFYEKMGFIFEGEFIEHLLIKGIYHNLKWYAIRNEKMQNVTTQNSPLAKFIRFKQMGDNRGHLVVLEGEKNIPFEIARVFYIYGSDTDVVRGQHANRKSEFVLINVSGTSRVKVDNGYTTEIFELNEPHTGIYIPKMIWKDMYDFSSDSVLLVLSNEKYQPEEYIKDYEEYLLIMRQST